MSFEPDPAWPAPDPSFNAYQGSPVDLPFPIISPFAIRGDLQKLPAPSGDLIRLDRQYRTYARAKLTCLVRSKSDFLVDVPGSRDPADGRVDTTINERAVRRSLTEERARQRLNVLIDAILAIVAATPGFAIIDEQGGRRQIIFATSGLTWRSDGSSASFQAHRRDAETVADWLNHRLVGRDPASWLAYGLALSVQEDFVVMRAADTDTHANASADADANRESPVESAGAIADALMVCLPSGWRPEEKLGASLSAIHAPVADGQALRRASASLSQAMLSKGPFERHVWTLSDSAVLNRHPDQMTAAAAASTEVWYRCERQTLLALPAHRRALFFIRVYVATVAQAAGTAERRELLVSALRSMSPAVIEYKNIGKLRDRVLALWG